MSLNKYTYCHNNPILNYDPSGHSIGSKFNEIIFAIKHPIIAWKIKDAKPDDLENHSISSNASRFAINSKVSYNKTKGQENEGGQRNAIRHAIWSTTITRNYGENVMKEIGYSHETLDDLADVMLEPKFYYTDMHTADTLCDILNNEIGIKIANSGTSTNMRTITLEVLEYYHTNGLNVAEKYADNLYIVKNQKLTDQEYAQAVYNVMFLDENGVKGDRNTMADVVKLRKKEAGLK